MLIQHFKLIELEIIACIVIADILNHSRQALHVVRQQSLLHVVSKQVAKQATEIFVAWI